MRGEYSNVKKQNQLSKNYAWKVEVAIQQMALAYEIGPLHALSPRRALKKIHSVFDMFDLCCNLLFFKQVTPQRSITTALPRFCLAGV